MEIRPVRLDDLPAIMALAETVPEAPRWTAAQYASLMGSTLQSFLVLEEAGELLGFAAAEVIRLPDESFAQLDSIVVHTQRRRMGLGRRLMEQVLDFAASQGASRVELEVRAGNVGAIAMYRRFGFEEQGIRKGYYRHPLEDAVLMVRQMQQGTARESAADS